SSFTIIGFLDESTLTPDEKVSIFVSVKNVSKDIFEQSNALYKKIGEGNFSSNRDLLFYSGQSTNTELMLTMYLVTSILIVIIMVGSISLIYNSFAISITERSSDFGMLSSIGATKKQKSKMVLFEAFIVSIVSIPFGIILGLLGIGITFKAISPLLTPMMNNEELKLVVLPCAIIIAIVFSLLTIFISAWIPARRAARATPIDAIRKTLDVKLNSKVVKTSKLTKKLFGFEAELALKNLKRNRRRYRTTLLSLVISLSLFLSAYAFTYYMSRSYSQLNEEINFDVIVSSVSGTINEHKRLNEEIMEQNYIEGATCVYTTDATAKVDHSLLTSFSKENSQVGDNLNLTFLSLDENSLNEYSKKVGVDINTLKDINNPSMIFINSYTLQKNKVYTDFKIFKSSNRLQPLNCSFSFYT
ncbi:MAG: FtsX-like permease family protein, partial [Oscillospiraceae bacterium]